MSQKRVVVIEDSPDDQLLFTRALRNHSSQPSVRMINDAEEALQALHAEYETPNAIFIDLNLPGMSGIELMTQLMKQPRYKTVPVIAMSGELTDQKKYQAFQAGAKTCITKDHSFSRWQVTIKDVLSYWFTVNCPMKPLTTTDQFGSVVPMIGKP